MVSKAERSAPVNSASNSVASARVDAAETHAPHLRPWRSEAVTGTRLKVTVHFNGAASRNMIVLHHGMFHTWEHFRPLMEVLEDRGIRAVIVDQQSANCGRFRNLIGLSAYRKGMEAAVRQIKKKNGGKPIVGYVLHSMGALIGQEMQQRSEDLRRPTVLMAPIPAGGALPVSVRTFMRHPVSFIWAVLRLNIHSLAKTPEQTRELFFAEEISKEETGKKEKISDEIVEHCAKGLRHAPFWTYCQLVLRPLLRPRIRDDKQRKLLLTSDADATFRPCQYESMENQLNLKKASIDGGHDFFLSNPEETADYIQNFFAQHVVPDPHFTLAKGQTSSKEVSEKRSAKSRGDHVTSHKPR